MRLSDDYIAVTKFEEPKADGFQSVKVQDSYVYKGVINLLPARPAYLGNEPLKLGDVVLFAKYSPDTHEIEELGIKLVKITDVLASL